MGGKGVRRRERNYKAAHGDAESRRLPPPPDSSKHDALPSKLRKLMTTFASASTTSHLGSDKPPIEDSHGNTKKRKRVGGGDPAHEPTIAQERGDVFLENGGGGDDGEGKKKSKKKRKRNQVKDLRFETLIGNTRTKEKRKERTKKYLESKKRRKSGGAAGEDAGEYPVKEHVRFGDVVQAPPKLGSLPKGAKKVIEASKEQTKNYLESKKKRKSGGAGEFPVKEHVRFGDVLQAPPKQGSLPTLKKKGDKKVMEASNLRLRLQAIEAYRSRKGGNSRLGLQLPSVASAATM